MLVKDIYENLKERITEENKKIIEEYNDFIKKLNRANFSELMKSKEILEFNKKIGFKLKEGLKEGTYYLENGDFSILLFLRKKIEDNFIFTIEDQERSHRTVFEEKFIKTCEIKDKQIDQQIGVTDTLRNVLKDASHLYSFIFQDDFKYTKDEIKDIMLLNEYNGIEETFINHLLKIKEIINDKKITPKIKI